MGLRLDRGGGEGCLCVRLVVVPGAALEQRSSGCGQPIGSGGVQGAAVV